MPVRTQTLLRVCRKPLLCPAVTPPGPSFALIASSGWGGMVRTRRSYHGADSGAEGRENPEYLTRLGLAQLAWIVSGYADSGLLATEISSY